MLLPSTAEYAMRIMAQFAISEDPSPLRAKDLAISVEVPVAYVSKILRKLVVAGLLHSQKGHQGGFVVAKPLHKIRLLDIMAAVDFSFEANRCAFGWGKCDPKKPCPLHPVWAQLSESASDWARRRTLQDVKSTWTGPKSLLVPVEALIK
jgi:Rrf2 family protein